MASDAAQKLLRKDQAEMQQQEAMKQQQDPLTVIQQKEIALKEAEFAHRKEMDVAKLGRFFRARILWCRNTNFIHNITRY